MDGAKPPQAGSHKSLMFPAKGKELFYHKGCKFAFVGVDQIRRRPLTVLLFRNCCKRNYVSKDNGQFQKAKLRLRRLFSLQPKVQHYSTPASLRVTKSAFSLCLMRRFASPTSKTAKAVFVGFCSIPRGQPVGLVCVGCHLYVGLDVYVTL